MISKYISITLVFVIGYSLIKSVKLVTYNNKQENKNKKNHIPREFSKNFEKKIYEIKNENIKNSLMKLIKAVNDDNS